MEYKNNKTSNRRRYKSRYHSPHNYKTKHAGSSNRAPILIGVATFVILASLVLVFTFGDNIYTFLDNDLPSVGAAVVRIRDDGRGARDRGGGASRGGAPRRATEARPSPTQAPVDQGDDFNRLLTAASLKAEDLKGTQAIFVESQGTSAKVYFYEKGADGQWTPKFDAWTALSARAVLRIT